MIKHVEINNFGPFELLKIDVSKFNIFYGKSLQGKTSVLDAIRWAVVGGNEDYFVRNGSTTAEVILYSDNGSRIERRLTRGGTSKLFIYDKTNKSVPTPQKVLNNMYNPLLFGPTDLLKMKDKDLNNFISEAISKRLKLSKEQIELYGLSDIDLSSDPVGAIKAYYDILYNERTNVNRFVKSASSQQVSSEFKNVTAQDIKDLELIIQEQKKQIDDHKSQNAKIEIGKKNLAIQTTTKNNINVLETQIQASQSLLDNYEENQNKLTELKTELQKNETQLIKDKEQYRLLKDGLSKIEKSEITCPLHPSIVCVTDMSVNVKQMKSTLENIESNGKVLLEKVQKIRNEIAELINNLEVARDLKNKKLELERSKSLLEELTIIDTEPIDVTKLESEYSVNNDKLSKMKVSLEMSKLTGLKEMQSRQEELNKQLGELDTLIKEVIPNMLTLGVKNVVLSKDGIYFQGLPLSRHGDSLKLRICTAILKDLYPSANLFCMDRIECIDQEELAKYVNYYSKENNDLQYFVTLVGKLDFTLPHNALAFKLDKFKVM